MSVQFTRTRQALSEQIREALDDLIYRRQIRNWSLVAGHDGRFSYEVWVGTSVPEFVGTPGECMDWLNARGYGVRVGKA